MKKLLPMLLFFLVPVASFGQGSVVNDIALKNLVTGIAPAGGATVTVCTSSGTGIPCTPLATIYSNVALTTPLTNPLTADSNGYYSFYATPGRYVVTVTGAGVSGRSITYILPSDISGNNTFPGNNTFKNINAIQFADQYSTTSTVAAPVNAAGTSQATGGSVAANSYKCEVTFNGATSGETTPSPAAAGAEIVAINSILYCVHKEYPPPAGALTYNVYWQTGGAGSYFLGHSAVALNLEDAQTTTPATSGLTPPVSNTALGTLPTAQTATGSPGTEIIPSTVSTSAGAPGAPLSGQTFLDYRNGNVIAKITDGHPWIVNAPGNFTGRVAYGVMDYAVNGCNPESEFRSLFTGQNSVQGINGCITIPGSSTTFQTNSLSGYVSNASGAATAGVAIFGGGRATTTNSRVWGINTIATDIVGAPTAGIYGAEFDTNTNNVNSIAHGVLSQILMNVQPTDSRAFEVGNPQQGAGCSPNCYWPYGLYFNTGATHAPLPSTGGLSAILFNPVNSGLNQASQGMAFAAFDPAAGTNYAAINEDATGNLLFQMGKGGGLFVPTATNARAITAKGDNGNNQDIEIIDTHAAGHTFDLGSMQVTGIFSIRDLSVASGPSFDVDLTSVTNGARSIFKETATANRTYTFPDATGTTDLTSNTTTTTTQVLHGSATAGVGTWGAIATADIAAALTAPGPIGGTTPSTGAFTTLSSTGNFTPSQTNGIVGTTTNNNANAGSVGEYVQSVLATGSSVTLATGVTSNVTSISLTAGDWDVTGAVDFTFGATTSYTNLIGSVSSTSATIGAQDSKFDFETPAAVPTAGADATFPLPVVRFSLSGTTTVFLVAQGTFTVSTLKAYGTIRARRIR